MIVVIGSGPAGVASATALVEQGLDVAMIDGGVQLEPERRALVEEVAARPREDWPAATLAELRRQMPVELGGVQLKFKYGSDFPYRDVARIQPFENRGVATHPTLARGGFSTVWGAAVLPYMDEDIRDWPISTADLAPHYEAVSSMICLSAFHDDLQTFLPLYCEEPRPLAASAQAAALMRDLECSRESLRRSGFHFGYSRLAVRAHSNAHGPGCVYCGLCLYGCPYELIYDASATLEQLQRSGNFSYLGDTVVERLEESNGGVRISARSRTSGEPLEFSASRVYVGCGVVSTTRLLLASLDAFDRPLMMKDSQYFLLPWLRWPAAPDPQQEALHTLAQVFIELRHGAVTENTVHLQVYTYNEFYRDLFHRLLGPATPLLRGPIRAALGRMLLIQGYLHSDVSPSISATLCRDGGQAKLVLEKRPNPETKRVLRRVGRRLLGRLLDFKAIPAWPMLKIAPPGRGFHSGGTFPMREAPSEFECDRLGRPTGFSRIHVVDSTTFPSIPATAITLSVMANAHRIASAHDET